MRSLNDKKNRRILIIDDNPAIHDDIRSILASDEGSAELQEAATALFGSSDRKDSKLDYEVDSAMQGQEGLAKVVEALGRERPYAVAFVDMRMPPGWDGAETIERIWREDPDLQIVICTAFSDHSWSDLATRLRHADQLLILKKPFDTAEVSQLAAALSEKWELRQQACLKMSELQQMIDDRTVSLHATNDRLQVEIEKGKSNESKLEAERTELGIARSQLEQKNRDLNRTLEKLKLAQATAIHAEKLVSVGQLASGIAHEINTPTQYVGDNTRFLKDGFGDLCSALDGFEKLLQAAKAGTVDEQLVTEVEATLKEADVEYLMEEIPQAIEQSLDGVERVAKIVRAMKEFSHPGGGERSLVNLNKAIETTIAVAGNEWKYIAEMVTEFDPELPQVSCLPDELNQVFLNLTINAAHAIVASLGENCSEKGRITVGTRHDGEWVEIFVRDTGTGIPEDVRARIFDPFFTTKGVGKGTGQGLAIARSVVVDKHGGTIDCETEEGKGTKFIVRLPINRKQ